MKPSDYPPQEPLPDFARAYSEEVLRRGEGIPCTEVQYGPDPYQSLSIFHPESPNGCVILFLHGGGWTCGYKEWNSLMAPHFTDEGCIFITSGYRLAPQHIFPTGFNDCADALAWIHNKVSHDPKKLFVGGHSAGGHLAALLTLAPDWRQERNLPQDLVAGCLPISGTFWFGENSGLSMRPRFLGPEDLANEHNASPMNFVDSAASRFFIAAGENDLPHLVAQSNTFADALEAHSHDVARHEIRDADHLGAHLATGEPGNDWTTSAVRWMLAKHWKVVRQP